MKQDTYLVPVDEYKRYNACEYRTVTRGELDKLLEEFSNRVLRLS